MTDKEMILNSSEEAASIQTVTGWVDRHGRFWGDDERMARWAGCTHIKCGQCGKPVEKSWLNCPDCREATQDVLWYSFKQKPWDGTTPVCIHDGDQYFFDDGEFYDWCVDEGVNPSDVKLVHCDPHFAKQVEEDNWCDDLPEDGELPSEIQAALDEFNAKIRACKEPLSWWPTKVAVDPASLRDEP